MESLGLKFEIPTSKQSPSPKERLENEYFPDQHKPEGHEAEDVEMKDLSDNEDVVEITDSYSSDKELPRQSLSQKASPPLSSSSADIFNLGSGSYSKAKKNTKNRHKKKTSRHKFGQIPGEKVANTKTKHEFGTGILPPRPVIPPPKPPKAHEQPKTDVFNQTSSSQEPVPKARQSAIPGASQFSVGVSETKNGRRKPRSKGRVRTRTRESSNSSNPAYVKPVPESSQRPHFTMGVSESTAPGKRKPKSKGRRRSRGHRNQNVSPEIPGVASWNFEAGKDRSDVNQEVRFSSNFEREPAEFVAKGGSVSKTKQQTSSKLRAEKKWDPAKNQIGRILDEAFCSSELGRYHIVLDECEKLAKYVAAFHWFSDKKITMRELYKMNKLMCNAYVKTGSYDKCRECIVLAKEYLGTLADNMNSRTNESKQTEKSLNLNMMVERADIQEIENDLSSLQLLSNRAKEELSRLKGPAVLALAQRMIAKSPMSPRPWLLQACGHILNHRNEKYSEEDTEKLRKAISQSVHSCVGAIPKFDKSYERFGEVLKSQVCDCAFKYGRILHHSGLMEEALMFFETLYSELQHTVGYRCKDLDSRLNPLLVECNLYHKLAAQKEKANDTFRKGNYKEAIRLYTLGMQTIPDHRYFIAIMFCNRAAAYMAIGDFTAALEDCSCALRHRSRYVKARIRRARARVALGKLDGAVTDLKRAYEIEKTPAVLQELREVQRQARSAFRRSQKRENVNNSNFNRGTSYYSNHGRNTNSSPDYTSYSKFREQEQSKWRRDSRGSAGKPNSGIKSRTKEKTYYQVLGVSVSESDSGIRKAYHKMALKFHPDKNPNSEDQFKLVQEAYETLKDSTKRRAYDLKIRIRTPVRSGFQRQQSSPNSPFYGGYRF